MSSKKVLHIIYLGPAHVALCVLIKWSCNEKHSNILMDDNHQLLLHQRVAPYEPVAVEFVLVFFLIFIENFYSTYIFQQKGNIQE